MRRRNSGSKLYDTQPEVWGTCKVEDLMRTTNSEGDEIIQQHTSAPQVWKNIGEVIDDNFGMVNNE